MAILVSCFAFFCIVVVKLVYEQLSVIESCLNPTLQSSTYCTTRMVVNPSLHPTALTR